MSGLVLSLKAEEKFLVNGALVQNGSKRSQIRLPDTTVNVLRLSDCLHPDDIDTPIKRAYYVAQLILAGDLTQAEGATRLMALLVSLEKVFAGTALSGAILKSVRHASNARYYSVLVGLRRLFSVEMEMLKPNMPSVEPVRRSMTGMQQNAQGR